MSRLNHNMSTTPNSPATSLEIKEEPRQKGARGGKRSVTHLSKAQLARKRANDREAQRNIRQRTKEHIESLEKKVKELESLDNGSRDSNIERVLQRNKQLELEIEQLRAQVRVPVQDFSMSPEAEDVMRKTVMGEWSEADAPSDPWSASDVPTMPIVIPQGIKIDHSQSFVNLDVPVYHTPTSQAGAFGIPDEASQQLYTPLTSGWENPGLTAPVAPAWPAFAPTFQQPSRFTEQSNQRGPSFTEVINTQRAAPNFQNSTCWQAQPSIYAWQISTKISAPSTLIDELMIGVIQSQRHLHMTADVTGQCLIGPSFPSVHVLFNQPGPVKPLSSANLTNMTLTDTMSRYSAVLSRRGFQLIPEKLASFMAMYRFVQWQISPCQSTYIALHEWQAPRPSQLIIPHPAWMDLPPWGKFRDKIIENQDRYGTLEFQNCYASNLNVNFPGDGMEALIFEDGQIKVSPLMEKHLSDLGNMSMRKPFADKYPEFADVCRFDEV